MRTATTGWRAAAIGFAMAGAVGISLALRDRPVMAIVGDGSAMYSIQALWTAAHLKLPITYVIANNRSYRILKERLKSMRGSERYIGMDLREPEIDFVGLAQSMGVPARRITEPDEVAPALRAAMAQRRARACSTCASRTVSAAEAHARATRRSPPAPSAACTPQGLRLPGQFTSDTAPQFDCRPDTFQLASAASALMQRLSPVMGGSS